MKQVMKEATANISDLLFGVVIDGMGYEWAVSVYDGKPMRIYREGKLWDREDPSSPVIEPEVYSLIADATMRSE